MTGSVLRSIGFALAGVGLLVPALAFGVWPGPAAPTDRLALALLFGLPAVIGLYRATAARDHDLDIEVHRAVASDFSWL